MKQINAVLSNVSETISDSGKTIALYNANIQPKLDCNLPFQLTLSESSDSATLSINETGFTTDDTTITMDSNNVLKLVKSYADVDSESEYQKLFTTIGPNISLDGNVLNATDSTYSSGNGVTVTDNVMYARKSSSTDPGTITVDPEYFTVSNGVLSLRNDIYHNIRTATTDDDILLSTLTPNITEDAGAQLYATLVDNDYVIYGGLSFTSETSTAAVNFAINVENDSDTDEPDLSLKVTYTSKTVGSPTIPVYLNNGVVTESTATVGSEIHPIFLKDGSFEECECFNASDSRHTLYINSGSLYNSSHSLGNDSFGIYLDNGVLKECRPSIVQFIEARTSDALSCSTVDYALGSDGASNPEVIASVESVTNTDSVVADSMDAGTTSFFARQAVELTSTEDPNFTDEMISVLVDHMKIGVLYTYSYSHPDKIYRTSATLDFGNYCTGNTLEKGKQFGLRIYTSNETSTHYHWTSYGTTYDVDALMCLYGFNFTMTGTYPFDDNIKVTDKNSVTMLFRRGVYLSDSYCGDTVVNPITSITLMRGPDMDGMPTVHVMGFNQFNT